MPLNESSPEEDYVPTADDQAPLNDEKMRMVTSAFKRITASRLCVSFDITNYNKSMCPKITLFKLQEFSHPRVLSRILKQFPALRDDLGALAIIRDPILLSSMKSAENFQEIAKQYPIFLQAAPVIAEVLNKVDSTKVRRVPAFDESDSSSSSSSSEEWTGNNPTNNNNSNINNNNGSGTARPITQSQLADALAFVDAAFRSAQASGASVREQPMDQSDAEPAVSPPVEQSAAQSQANLRAQYSQELIQMREMGLLDEDVNLQALQICNGDLEAAVNLVFTSTN